MVDCMGLFCGYFWGLDFWLSKEGTGFRLFFVFYSVLVRLDVY